MRYLIDTDWIINHLKGVERVTRKLEELSPQGLTMSIISLAELYEGIYRSTNPARDETSLKKFLNGVTVIRITEEVCQIFGRERARLRMNGKPIGDFDPLIASTCLNHDFILLTDNIKDFERVEGLRLLKR